MSFVCTAKEGLGLGVGMGRCDRSSAGQLPHQHCMAAAGGEGIQCSAMDQRPSFVISGTNAFEHILYRAVKTLPTLSDNARLDISGQPLDRQQTHSRF